MKPIKQTVYLPVEVEDASGNYIPDRSLLLVKEQGEMDKYWIDLVNQKQGYFFTPKQLNEYTQGVIKQALETAAKTRRNGFYDSIKEKQSITNTFEETYKKFEV